MMHQNSLKAWIEEQPSFSKRAKLILGLFVGRGSPMTDREAMALLGFSDMNSVRPRITELIKAGWLEECGQTVDSVTHKTVRLFIASEQLRARGCVVQQEMFGGRF